MCLITNKKKKIASRNMIVYKVMNRDRSDDTVAVSTIQYFRYNLNTEYVTEIKESVEGVATFSQIENRYLINTYSRYWQDELKSHGLKAYGRGFHSMTSAFLKQYKESEICDEEVVYKCLIPKGSEYIEDFVGLIISNKIIIKKRMPQ